MSQTFEDQVLTMLPINLEAFWHRLPIYVVWVYGLLLAWRRRQRHRRVSLVAFLALAGFLLVSLGGTFLGSVLVAQINYRGWSLDVVGSLLGWLDLAENLLVAALWILVLVAAFGGRQAGVGRATTTTEPVFPEDRIRKGRTGDASNIFTDEKKGRI